MAGDPPAEPRVRVRARPRGIPPRLCQTRGHAQQVVQVRSELRRLRRDAVQTPLRHFSETLFVRPTAHLSHCSLAVAKCGVYTRVACMWHRVALACFASRCRSPFPSDPTFYTKVDCPGPLSRESWGTARFRP
eukprot:3932561-Rhodomonas_salina.1